MRGTTWLVGVAAGLAGCTGYPEDHVADLAATVVCSDSAAGGWSFHHGPVPSVSAAGCGDLTCHWLAPVAGQPARIEVSPATDTLHGVSTSFDGAWLDCFEGVDQPRIFQLTKTDLAIDGNAITFTAPTTSFHGTATCYLGVTVAVGVAECSGFLGCASLVPWPTSTGSALHPEAWVFTAQL